MQRHRQHPIAVRSGSGEVHGRRLEGSTAVPRFRREDDIDLHIGVRRNAPLEGPVLSFLVFDPGPDGACGRELAVVDLAWVLRLRHLPELGYAKRPWRDVYGHIAGSIGGQRESPGG